MKKLVFLSCITCVALSSIASAETLYIAGSAGVRDQSNSTCSDPYVPTGEMLVPLGPMCTIGYPINLPVGKTIESIEIAYDGAFPVLGRSITAYLGQDRVKPKLGAIAIAGASNSAPPVGSQGFLNMQPLNIQIASGSVYWVQVFDQDVNVLDYVAVTYH